MSGVFFTGTVKGQTWSGVLFRRSNIHPMELVEFAGLAIQKEQ